MCAMGRLFARWTRGPFWPGVSGCTVYSSAMFIERLFLCLLDGWLFVVCSVVLLFSMRSRALTSIISHRDICKQHATMDPGGAQQRLR